MVRELELRAPLAVAVIGGLALATLLTLFFVPVIYQELYTFRARFARRS